jgi:chemotaxis protein histidine kinase CheA
VTESGSSTALNAKMAELKQKFVTRTTAEVGEMRVALAQLVTAAENDQRSSVERIRQLAHRACGTGGTLGLCSLSDAAGTLEQLAESCLANPTSSDAARADLAAGIDRIAAELASL